MTGNSRYLVAGGEFPKVNGTAEQGLVRFAVPSLAPNKQGPRVSAAAFVPTVIATSATTARISWTTNWDRDDQNLTYQVWRNNGLDRTTTATSQSWNEPVIGIRDANLTPGATYTYRIRANDPTGNAAWGNPVSITLPTAGSGPPSGQYVTDVTGDGASSLWRLDQAPGAAVNYDAAGFTDLSLNTGVAGGSSGPLVDGDTASAFNGSSTGFGATRTAIVGPNTFTEEAWFNTSSTAGGKIVGFGNANTGTSTSYDRHIYLDTTGRINFGVLNGTEIVVTSPSTYNNGKWHYVVSTLSSAGMALFVDGALVAASAKSTIGKYPHGYWRVGGDPTGAVRHGSTARSLTSRSTRQR